MTIKITIADIYFGVGFYAKCWCLFSNKNNNKKTTVFFY